MRKLTHDIVKNIAKIAKTRSEFVEKDNSAYNYARRHKILEEICSHMKTISETTKNKKNKKTMTCRICKEDKDKKNFTIKKDSAYGVQSYCRQCYNKVQKKYQKTKKGVIALRS